MLEVRCRIKCHRMGGTIMKYRIVGLGIVLLGFALVQALGPQAAADDKKDDQKGWVQLFNGKDLTGWKMFPRPNTKDIQEIIKKEEGGKIIAYYGKLTETGQEMPLW